MTTDPWGRGMLWEVSWRLLVVFAAGWPSSAVCCSAAAAPRAALEAGASRRPRAAGCRARHRRGRQASRGRCGRRAAPSRRSRAASATCGAGPRPGAAAPRAAGAGPAAAGSVAGVRVRGRRPSGREQLGRGARSRLVMLAVVDAYAAALPCSASPACCCRRGEPGCGCSTCPTQRRAYLMRWTRRFVVVRCLATRWARSGCCSACRTSRMRRCRKPSVWCCICCWRSSCCRSAARCGDCLRAPAGPPARSAPVAQPLRLGLALDRAVLHRRDLAGLGGRDPGRLRRAAALLRPHRGVLLIGARLVLILLVGTLDRAERAARGHRTGYPACRRGCGSTTRSCSAGARRDLLRSACWRCCNSMASARSRG